MKTNPITAYHIARAIVHKIRSEQPSHWSLGEDAYFCDWRDWRDFYENNLKGERKEE